MLACLQRRQNPNEQQLACAGRTLEAPPTPNRKCEVVVPVHSNCYPSPAELDAYAQKTSDSPLSIRIFPPNVRVPQHKHLGRTINGFDTSSLRYSPYPQPHSRCYPGLLAIAKPSFVPTGKSTVKSRTKPPHVTLTPYPLPPRHPQTTYPGGNSKSLSTQPNLPSIQNLIYQVPGPAPQLVATGVNGSPSGVGGFVVGECTQDGLNYPGGDSAKGYAETVDYILWRQRQANLRMYAGVNGSPMGGAQTSSWPYPSLGGGASGGSGVDGFGSSPLNCGPMHSHFSAGQYFAAPWNSVLATPTSDGYSGQEPHHPLPPPQPTRGLGSGTALSSSLQSLEFLISGIRPPCIKEQMLGKGYEAVGVPRLLDHQHAHIRLPVYR